MPVQFNISIANKVIGVTTFYDFTYHLCKNYLTDVPCDFHVLVTKEDIQYEREMSKKSQDYSDSYLESLAVYRGIATKMLTYDTLLFHGSAIAVDGEAYLFAAKSGMGKSTHTRMWMEHFGSRAVMINDDKPLLKFAEERIYVCGTPWDGKHRLSSNISVPLKAIAILERDMSNHISRIDKRSAFPILIQQSFRPRDTGALMKTTGLVDRLGNNVELYRLGCNMQPEAVDVSYNGMNERNIKS